MLPFLVAGGPWQQSYTWYALSRFFLIYAICIIFDYRDREDDKIAGIKSMITWLDARGIDRLFIASISLCILFTLFLFPSGLDAFTICSLLLPAVVTSGFYSYAKTHFSDYLYNFVLDGLMMLSVFPIIIKHI